MVVKSFDNGQFVSINDVKGPEGVCHKCGKANYIIKVDHIQDQQRKEFGRDNGIEKYGGIPVDFCIGQEVEGLINQGVITKACCCGHGEWAPHCLIDESSVCAAKLLGYEPEWYSPGLWSIKLKDNKGAAVNGFPKVK